MNRSLVRLTACGALLVLLAAVFWTRRGDTGSTQLQCSSCNVILISIDTLRADHLGCYGYAHPTSPAIDGLSRESTLFTAAIAQAPSTAASHGAIFTSMLPAFHGALFSRRASLSKQFPTLAEILRSNGFATASFNGGGQIISKFGFDRGFDIYRSIPGRDGCNDRFIDQVEAGIEWLNDRKNERFFLFLHSYEAHLPYCSTSEKLPWTPANHSGSLTLPITASAIRGINKGRQVLPENDRAFVVAAYDAEIRSVDAGMARLVEYMRETGLIDTSIIVFTSDHGEEFGEHGKIAMHSHTLYDELLKVPLIVRLPHKSKARRSVAEQVRSIDIMPTILEYLAIPAPPHLQGTSLLGLMLEQAPPTANKYAFSQRDTKFDLPISIRTTEWKAHHKKLFNLKSDPGELHDIASAHADINAALINAGKQAVASAAPDRQDAAELDSEALRQLKTLGYLK